MYPKSPIGQMYPNQGHHSYTPYPIPQLPPMAQKKKSFLSKLFKKHDPTEPFMQMVPPYRQTEGPPMMYTTAIPATAIPTAILTAISTVYAATSSTNDTTSNV